MSKSSNQFPAIPPIQTTETFLLECSRSNSLIDKSQYKLQGGETNATWINSTSNFEIKKGDQISIEMVALNLAQTTTPMEFTGQNVILEGADEKKYVDNKVLLEIGYYINNNQSYTNNLPFYLSSAINDVIDSTSAGYSFGVNRQNIFPMPDPLSPQADFGVYPGYGMGFGSKYATMAVIGGQPTSTFQYPNTGTLSYSYSYRIVGFTDQDYVTPLPMPLAVGANPYSVILERDKVGAVPADPPATPSAFTSIKAFLEWKDDATDRTCYGKVGMNMNFENDNGEVEASVYSVVDIRQSTAGAALFDEDRVQVCFPKDSPNGQIGGMRRGEVASGAITAGRACCFTTPKMRYNDIFRQQGQPSWNFTDTDPTTRYSQKRQNSGITDFFSNGLQGNFDTTASGTIPAVSILNLAYPLTDTSIHANKMNFFPNGGIGSANRLQGTDNLPYIITRNDYMGSFPKANCEDIGRYKTFTPNLKPLTSFIELEATDLLMDATALANKINEKLHQSLPAVGNNSDDINQYQTNVYGFTRRYKKSSQLLPYNNYEGYYPLHAYPQTDGTATGGFNSTYLNTQMWNTIDSYFSGGCKQIIPANYQPGFNNIDFVGFNSNLYLDMDEYLQDRATGSSYPSFESTYLRTCKRPPDWYGDSCSWNNIIDGNKGVKDIFKAMWGDAFNRIPCWDGNAREVGGTYRGGAARNFNMPVILNTQLQNYSSGNQLLRPSSYFDLASFNSTLLIKNQMIFTNIYYSKASLIATESPGITQFVIGEDWFEDALNNLIDKQRDLEIYINTSNKTADTYEKQRQDNNGWAIELDLGMTNDYLTTKWTGADLQEPEGIPLNWCINNLHPPEAAALPYPSFIGGAVPELVPTLTSAWFGSGSIIPQIQPPIANGDPIYDWNKNQGVNRPVGRIWIQSRYDSNWVKTSNTGGELPYPNNKYPQIPVSVALNDTRCSFVKPNGEKYADDTWSKDNDMGIYPYEYTDVDGGKHIFCAFRVAQVYKAVDSATINSQITNTWRIGQLQWGLRFGYSPSAYDNYAVTPMNCDTKPHNTIEVQQTIVPIPLPAPVGVEPSLIQNANAYVAIGAANPTFNYDPTKSRMEISQTYKPTQLSPFNTSGATTATTVPPNLPELGENVAMFNDKCPDAFFSPPPPPTPPVAPTLPGMYQSNGGGLEKNQNQRSEESGIFIYKVWLPDENWSAPTDINLYSYWSNNEPDGRKFLAPPAPPGYELVPNFALSDITLDSPPTPTSEYIIDYKCRDNQDNTENNREEIIKGCVEATDENWRGSLLSKLGFTKEQLLPLQGRQYNRYSVNGYNNPQPDLIVTQNTKPLILNNQSNITLDTAFNINYINTPVAPLISGLPNYGLGFANNLPVVTNSTNATLTAINPVESTNSPFFQIYSTICPNHYLDNGTRKSIMFYCMKNYQSGNYSYGYGSTFAHTATKSYNLDQIHTEIRNPITGRLMRVLQPNSVITYKITRPIILAPDPYDPETGLPIDPLTTEPIAQDLEFNTDELFNLVPPQQGGGIGNAGGSIPPAEQEKSYFFNGNNQVVNLQSDEAVALQAQEQQGIFNPINSYIPNPNDETKGETKSQSFITPPESEILFDPFQQANAEAGVIQNVVLQQEEKVANEKGGRTAAERKKDALERRNAKRREDRASESEESGSERRAKRTAKDRSRREERRKPEQSVPANTNKGADVESMPPPPPRPPHQVKEKKEEDRSKDKDKK